MFVWLKLSISLWALLEPAFYWPKLSSPMKYIPREKTNKQTTMWLYVVFDAYFLPKEIFTGSEKDSVQPRSYYDMEDQQGNCILVLKLLDHPTQHGFVRSSCQQCYPLLLRGLKGVWQNPASCLQCQVKIYQES